MLVIYDSLLLFGRGNHHRHSLAFEHRHVLGTAELFELYGETEELLLSLVLEHDRASAEEDCGFHFGAFLEEFPGVLQFELEVVLVGIGAETDFLEDNLSGVRFHLLRLLALLVQIFLIVQDLADGGIGLGADLHQIKFELIGNLHRLRDGIDALLRDIVPDKTNLRSGYLLIDSEFILVLLLKARIRFAAFSRFRAGRLRSVRRCDKAFSLNN